MKICTRCKIEQEEIEFRWKNKEANLRQAACRICCTIAAREKRRNFPSERKRIRKAYNEIKERNSKYIWDYLLEHPCVDCKESDPIVLEFDHHTNKSCDVAVMVQGFSIIRIQKEIDKCVVRCANCHRRKTAKERNYFKFRQSIAESTRG